MGMAMQTVLLIHRSKIRKNINPDYVLITDSTQMVTIFRSLYLVRNEILKLDPTEDEWQNIVFCDFNYSGWSRETIKTIVYQKETEDRKSSNVSSNCLPWYLTKVLAEEIEMLIRKKLPTLFQYLVQNHPTLQGENTKNQKGIASDIQGHIYRRVDSSINPTNLINYFKAYDTQHMYLIKGIVAIFPTILLEKDSRLVAEFLKLVEANDEVDQQCTASELFSGFLTASQHFDFQTQRAMQKILSVHLKKILVECQPDSIIHWINGLRIVLCNNDPRRLIWIIRMIFLNAFESDFSFKDSPSVLQKSLCFVKGILIEGCWRVSDLGGLILHIFQKG